MHVSCLTYCLCSSMPASPPQPDFDWPDLIPINYYHHLPIHTTKSLKIPHIPISRPSNDRSIIYLFISHFVLIYLSSRLRRHLRLILLRNILF